MQRRTYVLIADFAVALLAVLLLTADCAAISTIQDRIRLYTYPLEFNYTDWLLRAWFTKAEFGALGAERFVPQAGRRETVLEYAHLMGDIGRSRWKLQEEIATPNGRDEKAIAALRAHLREDYRRRSWLAPIAEQIIQEQISLVLAEQGVTLGGEPIPPVMYRTTDVPMALVVSPRNVIRQIANISLRPGLTLDQQIQLEDKVAHDLNLSTLVVPIGGVGVYPTMVMQTGDLPWLIDTVAHEWTHNYLAWHPLGMHYDSTPEMRVINETTANIVGKEVGRMVLKRFYPELLPPPPPPPSKKKKASPNTPPPFDFRAEMHKTRVHVDELLAEGKIEEAEAYMEQRRKFFWEHGYHIRKLNQAYFAFYGAYADVSGGAAGATEDPVGAAVRKLRAQSPSVGAFLKRIAHVSSFAELKAMVEEGKP